MKCQDCNGEGEVCGGRFGALGKCRTCNGRGETRSTLETLRALAAIGAEDIRAALEDDSQVARDYRRDHGLDRVVSVPDVDPGEVRNSWTLLRDIENADR